jgi:transcription elongation factor GreA
MKSDSIPITPEGYEKSKKELENLKKIERHKVIQDIAEARAHGDLKENAEYAEARERQGIIEARISFLEQELSRAQIVNSQDLLQDTVGFGAWVTLCDEETQEEKKYRVVGDLEADINNNYISVSSPIARAILGKKTDDLIEIKVPKGIREYSILKIEY